MSSAWHHDADVADLLADLDPATIQRVAELLAINTRTTPPSRTEVQDSIDRVSGRITFEEYLRRCRARGQPGAR